MHLLQLREKLLLCDYLILNEQLRQIINLNGICQKQLFVANKFSFIQVFGHL